MTPPGAPPAPAPPAAPAVRPASLWLRMGVGAVLWITLALTSGAWVLVELFRAHVVDQTQQRLVTDMDQVIASLVVDTDGSLFLDREPSDPRFHTPFSGLYWQVGEAPAPVLRSRSLWDDALPLPVDTVAGGEIHLHRIPGPRDTTLLTAERQIRLPDLPGPVRVAVALDAEEVAAAVRRFTADLALASLALGCALIAAALLQVFGVLRPFSRLRLRVLDVRRGAAERVEGTFPTEVTPLVDDLNTLLDHRREAVERARRQAGDLAHGLKTPLAVIDVEAQDLALRGETEAAAVIREQVDAMRRQVETNLARARAAAMHRLPGALTPVADALAPLASAIARLHGKTFEVEVPAALRFHGDAQDLQEMAGTLLDNAGKWAVRRVVLRASVTPQGRLEIRIDDDGPGLPDSQHDAVFDRGTRLDEAKPGTGLGLGIARDLAELYGGSVSLATAPDGGCRAVLDLPGEADDPAVRSGGSMRSR